MGISAKQDIAIENLGWTIEHKCVPKAHQRCLDILKKERKSLSKGMASDLVTVMSSIGSQRKWPNFQTLEQSAVDGMKKREEKKKAPEFMRPTNAPTIGKPLTKKEKRDLNQGKLFQ